MTSLVRAGSGAKRMMFALALSLLGGCSSLGGFDYGDGEADRFTAGDDVPYVPTDDDDDASSSASATGHTSGQTGTGVDPTSTDDGAMDSTDLRPDDSSSSDDSGSSSETGDTEDGTETADPADTDDLDTSGTSGADEPSNLPPPAGGTEGESSTGGSDSTSGD